jgi:hypothetical protein
LLIDYVRKRMNTGPRRISGDPGHAFGTQQ